MKTKITFSLLMLSAGMLVFFACKKKPTAGISADKTSAIVGETVTFTSTSTNADHVKWIFPDGSSSTSNQASFVFTTSGNHNVSLTAYSKNEKKSDQTSIAVNVTNPTDKYVGTWNANEQCTTPQAYTFSVTASGSTITINPLNQCFKVTGDVTGMNFTIPSQTVNSSTSTCGFPYTISGSGSINSSYNTLTYNYKIVAGSFTTNCTGTATK